MNTFKPQKNIRVMIVEDHVIFREGLKKALAEIKGVKVIGEAENGTVFLKMLDRVTPDIVFMDIKMPVMDGLEATEKALKRYPHLKIIVITMFGEESYLYSMIQKGISGFIIKNARIFEIERAIESVINGEQYFSPEINSLLAKKVRQLTSGERISLTSRENEILLLLCKGYSTSEISKMVKLSNRTIEGYRTKLLEKTNQPNVINLILFAIKNRLIVVEEIEPRNP